MRYLTKGICSSLFFFSSLASTQAFAAAYQLYELGSPIIGTAAVGQAALAADASTAYFNPAGMAFLPGTEYLLGSQIILPYVNFKHNTANTIFGDNGGNAGELTPGMDMFYVYSYNCNLKFGLAVTSPYAGSLNYTDGWVGRYIVQNELFYTININPSVSWRANDWLSLGAGFAVEYVNLMQTFALPILHKELLDGQANIKAANVNAGFNLGVIVTPKAGTRIGVAYRSQIVHNLTGTTTFLRLPFTPTTKTKIIMPSNVVVSLAQDVSCYGKLLAEAGWAAWSSMRASVLHVSNFSVTTPLNWNNTYRVGIGGQLNVIPDLIFQAGISYDSSPTTASARLPDLPFDGQTRVAGGLLYTMREGVQLSTSYEYMSLGSAAINNASGIGVLSGHYSRNYMNTLQFGLNIII